jgi:hypothetical protein
LQCQRPGRECDPLSRQNPELNSWRFRCAGK